MTDLEQKLVQTGGEQPLVTTPGETKGEEKEDDKTMVIATTAGGLCFMCDYNDGMLNAFLVSWYMLQGLDISGVGFCYLMIACGMLLMAPMARVLVNKYGANKVQFYGGWAFTFTRFWGGLAPLCPRDKIQYFLFVNAFCTGLHISMTEIGAVAWVMSSVPVERRTEANGVLTATRSAAGLIAPAIGGILYQLGGFSLPIESGCAIIAMFLIAKKETMMTLVPAYAAPLGQTKDEKSSSVLTYLPCFIANISSFLLFTFLQCCIVFFQPLFYFDYKVSSSVFGISMSLLSLCFVVGAMLSAKMQKAYGTISAILTGHVLMAFGFLWLGPSPLLAPMLPSPSPWSVWVPLFGMAFAMVGFSMPITIWTPFSINYAASAGWEEGEASAQQAMLGVLIGGVAMGLGPCIGGFLVNKFGIGMTSTIIAIWILTVVSLPSAVLKSWEAKNGGRPARLD